MSQAVEHYYQEEYEAAGKTVRRKQMPKEKTNRFGKELATLIYQGAGKFLSIWRLKKSGQEIVTKKDAVAILVYNYTRQQLLFVNQYRPAIGGISLEAIAGHIEECPKGVRDDDWAKETMVRELQEEAGVSITPSRIQLVHPFRGFYVSPGFTTEKIWLGYVQISDEDMETTERVFGLAEEGEATERVWLGLEGISWNVQHSFQDMKTMLLVYWFLYEKLSHVWPSKQTPVRR